MMLPHRAVQLINEYAKPLTRPDWRKSKSIVIKPIHEECIDEITIPIFCVTILLVLFNIVIYLSYTLLILSSLGFSQSAPKYLEILDYYLRIYICLFLIWRFNPLRTYYEFTDLDRKIAFSGGLFILTTTILNQYLILIKDKTKKIIQNKNQNLNS